MERRRRAATPCKTGRQLDKFSDLFVSIKTMHVLCSVMTAAVRSQNLCSFAVWNVELAEERLPL